MVNLFTHLREIERFTQRAHKRFIMTDRLPGPESLATGFPVTFHEFNHDIERFYLRDIAGQGGYRCRSLTAREAKWR